MMRSLFSGVSGLKVHQTKMDVIGNNIANVNTVGFKSSSVNFSDVFYQTTQSATGPNANTGSAGQNAMQIGLGSNLASITTNITGTGGSQRTDNPFDVMISGDSFFIVNSGGTNYFTKAGAFNVDAAGTLCTASGANVMGWGVDKASGEVVQDVVAPLKIMSPENLYAEPSATSESYIQGNIDMNSTQIASTSLTGYPIQINFYDNMGNSYNAKFSIKQTAAATNVYDVNLVDVQDKNGNSLFSKKDIATGNYLATGAKLTSVAFGTTNYATPTINPTTGAPTFTATAQQLTFNAATGAFTQIGTVAGTKAVKMNLTTSGANPFSATGIDVDFSSITMYANSGTTSLESAKGDLSGLGTGRQVGNMTGVKIDGAGKIYGTYDNGEQKMLGQVAVTTFANPSGLESVGDSMFAQTQNSGEFDGIGQDPTTGGGSLTTGVLEMSNVDLSQEFTSMITTQRGFQANSRIITTSDTLLEELINLKR